MMDDAPQNVHENEIAQVRIFFCFFGVRDPLYFLYSTSTSYWRTSYLKVQSTKKKFHPDNMHPKSTQTTGRLECMPDTGKTYNTRTQVP
jgi:hypothetical protein